MEEFKIVRGGDNGTDILEKYETNGVINEVDVAINDGTGHVDVNEICDDALMEDEEVNRIADSIFSPRRKIIKMSQGQ